jgi:opacity protein-like surface antigen
MSIRKAPSIRHLLIISLLTAAAATTGVAQEAFEIPLGIGGTGIRVASASVWGQYLSQGLPTASSYNFAGRTPQLGADGAYGFSSTLTMRESWGRTSFSLLYTPSYTGRLNYTQWNAFNHHLGFHINHPFSAKFRMYFSGEGSQQTLDQFLFEPTTTGRIPGVPHSFQDLVNEFLSGKLTEEQFTALLTGEHIVSPIQTLLYGNRLTSGALHNGYAYQLSPRIDLNLTLSAIHTEHTRNFQDNQTPLQQVSFVPKNTAVAGRIGIGYRLSSRTRVELNLTEADNFSSFQNFRTTTGVARIATQFGPHWLLHLSGGGGTLRPQQNALVLLKSNSGVRWVGAGGIGYKSLTQVYLLSVDRSISDQYGIGASRMAANFSWNWRRPGTPWGLLASANEERLNRVGVINLNAWLARGGISRALNRNMQLNMEYAYLSNHSRFQNLPNSVARNSARIALVWNGSPNTPYGGGAY